MKIQSILFSALSLAVLQAQDSGPKNISICYETFSLPLAMAAKLQREQIPDAELYDRLVNAVEKQTVKQETFTVLRGKSGLKSTAESISEQIYPTKFNPPELPNSVGVSITLASPAENGGNGVGSTMFDGIRTPATPTAFDTRNTGTKLEIEPTCSADGRIVDLRIVTEHVTLVGRSSFGQGGSTIEVPVFETQRINSDPAIQINRPFLLGTLSRPPVSKVDPDSANQVWFAFVTGTFPRP